MQVGKVRTAIASRRLLAVGGSPWRSGLPEVYWTAVWYASRMIREQVFNDGATEVSQSTDRRSRLRSPVRPGGRMGPHVAGPDLRGVKGSLWRETTPPAARGGAAAGRYRRPVIDLDAAEGRKAAGAVPRGGRHTDRGRGRRSTLCAHVAALHGLGEFSPPDPSGLGRLPQHRRAGGNHSYRVAVHQQDHHQGSP